MNIEPLESRIAPAGVVTITATANDLRFVGDAEANVITIENTLVTGFLRVEASAGTMLRFGDQTGTSFDIPLGARKNMRIDLGAGDDELTLRDIALPGNLDVRGGAGNNTVTLAGLMEAEGIFYYTGGDDSDTLISDFGPGGGLIAKSVLIDLKGGANFMDYTDDAASLRTTGVFQVLSGDGDDTIDIHAATGRFGGLVTKLGAGANSSSIILEEIFISGYVLAEGGSGADSLSLLSRGDMAIRKTLTTKFGDGAGAVEVGAAGALTVTGKSSFIFGKTTPSPTETASVKLGGTDVRLGPVSFSSPAEWFAEATCIVAGYVDGTGVDEQTAARTVRMGATTIQGATDVTMNANAIAVRGSIGITSTDAADVTITAGYIDVNGNVTAALGNGDGSFVLVGESIEITGKLALGFGDGEHTTEIGVAGGSLSAASISIANRTGTVGNNETVTISGNVSVSGAFSLVDGAGNLSAQFAGGALDVGGAMTLVLGDGGDEVDLSGSSFAARSFNADLGPGANTLGFSWGESSLPTGKIKGGENADIVTFGVESGFIGLLNVDLGAGANDASIEGGGGLRIGKLTHVSASGAAAVLDRLNVEGVVVREISANLGLADSILNIARSRVGKLTANLGAGADTMRMDDNLVTGAVLVNTGFGNDRVLIEQDANEAGESVFLDRVIFTLSDGDDEVLVADAADETKATFRALFAVYGDAGTDTFTPHATNAVFARTPVLTGIP